MRNNLGKPPSQIRPFLAIAWYSLKAQLRNRATVTFGFLFPILFISVFGLIGESATTINIGVPSEYAEAPISRAVKKISALKIETGEEQSLKVKLSQGRLAGVLTQRAGQPVLITSQSNPQNAAAVVSIISSAVDKMNLQMSGVVNPPVNLQIEEISGRNFRYIDFALPGIIGFALLTTSINGVGFGLVFLKKTLVLKRIFATPTKGSTIILGQAGSRIIIALAQALVILGFGIFAFHFKLVNGLVTLGLVLLLVVLGLMAFLGFGLFVGGLASDESTVAPLASIITLPQFLIAGTFFPIDVLPKWVQPAANILPLSFFNAAIRKITVEGLFVTDILPQLLGLAVWSIAVYFITSLTFKWE